MKLKEKSVTYDPTHSRIERGLLGIVNVGNFEINFRPNSTSQ